AEKTHGFIPRAVDYSYVWGDAIDVLKRVAPDARIANLETAVTSSDEAAPKGINYRMHPANAELLSVAGLDCCVLANNHVLDWGHAGLCQTLETLERIGVRASGAGRTQAEAEAPAILPVNGVGRVLVFAYATPDSGVPASWAARRDRSGVNWLSDLSDASIRQIVARVTTIKRTGDVAIVSMHWGSNWGFEVPARHRAFAHALIDRARVDVVFGHSSHHAKAIEVYESRPIFYGCGDFLNDYEGIGGKEAFRDDLAVAYFPTLSVKSGELIRLTMAPLQIRRFRLQHASRSDRAWLATTLDRECRRFGRGVSRQDDMLELAP
ncbi:MAG TPA: CapA family protein, partial [Gemmatimonadaceae bacterium]